MTQAASSRFSGTVVFVTSTASEGAHGPGTYTGYVLDALTEAGISVEVVAPPSAQVKSSTRLELGGRSADLYPRLSAAASEVASRHSDAVVHANNPLIVKDYRGTAPLVVQANDYDSAELLRHPHRTLRREGARRFASLLWRRRVERQVFRRADLVVANSDYTASAVAQAYGLDSAKVVTLPKVVDVEVFRRGPTERVPTSIIFVGSNFRRKGLPVLLEAVAFVRRSHPDVSLTVVGPSEEAVRQLPEFADVADATHLAGRLDRSTLAAALASSEIYCLPYGEAFGVAGLEALAAGALPVCSGQGGVAEALGGSAAHLGPDFTAEQLATALARALDDGVAKAWCQANGADHVASAFDASSLQTSLPEIYVRATAQQARR